MIGWFCLVVFAVAIPGSNSEDCKDIQDKCEKYKHYCYQPENWNNYMKKYCRKTCTKHCDRVCKDVYNRCLEFKENCYVGGKWEEYMKINCQGTCKKHCLTGGGGGNGTESRKGKCGISSVSQSRIINGVDAYPGAWPWMVSLNRRGRTSHFCGGTLISPIWVLTASHCVDGQYSSALEVIAGEHDRFRNENTEQKINVKRIIMHHAYDKRYLSNDIALLELEKPVQLNKRVKTVCLPPSGYRPPTGQRCYLSGWGTITHPGNAAKILQQAMLPVVGIDKCFNSDVVCAGFGKKRLTNACRGDSGGPLVCQEKDGRWVQQGIASFVITYCKYYTGFAPTGKYIDWIRHYTKV